MNSNKEQAAIAQLPDLRLAQRPGDRIAIWVLGSLLLVEFVYWLSFTPPGFWGKLTAIGHAVCHQLPERSFTVLGHQFPLCARCTGMYIGAFLGLLVQLSAQRKGKLPPLVVIIPLALLFSWFALDGVNSFLTFLPNAPHLFETTNATRLFSGLGTGLGIIAVLYPLTNQTVWVDWVEQPAMASLSRFLLALALLGMTGVAIYFAYDPFPLLAAILSPLTVLGLLTTIYTVISIFLLRRENLFRTHLQLLLPFLMGLFLALTQILASNLIRRILIGDWGPLNLR